MSGELRIYAIYDHPTDYPDNYVVRCWLVSVDGLKAEGECQLAASLSEARRLIPSGLYVIPRYHDDDPVVVETWL